MAGDTRYIHIDGAARGNGLDLGSSMLVMLEFTNVIVLVLVL